MEFAASLTTEIAKYLARVTVDQARYSFCFDSLVEDLGKEKEKLESTIESVEDSAKKAQDNTDKVENRVHRWLKESNDLIKEVDKLDEGAKSKENCCHGRCPDLIWQYRLGKQVAKKTEAMKTLNDEFKPQKLSRSQSLLGMGYFASENFIYFKSTKRAYDELWKALRDNKIRRIGLYGMGGCGKTTLVKEVGKAAEKLFKKVVFVAVSSTLEVRKIQGSIADALNLTLREENEPERARRLWIRLSGSEKILLILDDVWEELDFEAIGIPFSDDHKGCRILLTTRHRGVCASLKCDEKVPLDLLTDKEAWQLFKKYSGLTDDASKTLKRLPEVIIKACQGLPVIIAAVASTLKEKTPIEWKVAADRLKHCEQVDIESATHAYESLQLSYDNLKNKEAKDMFLLCSLFPEDSEIKEEDVIRMARGLGLFENVYSWESARIRGGATIQKLLDSFLLLQAKKGRSVVLHDILRAVALKIAGQEIQTILEPRKLLTALPEQVATEEITKLYCHNINEFPHQFSCPKLEILIVCKDGKGSSQVPDNFFEEMGGLKVLTVIDKSSWQNSILLLPKSIWSLKCLRTLCLRGCRLDEIFSLQNLQNLDTLEFTNCSIVELPTDIAELRKLKLLDASCCRIGGNPYKVLGSCPRLEELYFLENDLDEELFKDQNLAEFFGKDHYFTGLQRYHIQIGARVDKLKDDLKSAFLSICPNSDQDTSTSTAAIKDLAQRAEVLFLENVQKSCRNVIPDIVREEGGSMNELTELLLRNSHGMKCLIDTTNQLNQIGPVFTNLHKLRITGMTCMEGFCHGQPPSGLFEQLEELECSQLPILSSLGKPKLSNLLVLKLESCPKLESLFTPAVAVSLVLLEELNVTKCNGLMYVITDDKEENIPDANGQKSYGSVFKKLKQIVVGECEKLEYLIPLSFAWGLKKLRNLKIYTAPNLRYAFGQCNQSSHQSQNQSQIIKLPVLKELLLLDLPNIIRICPENYDAKWPDLLDSQLVHNCPKLTIELSNTPKVDSESEVQVQQGGETPRKGQVRLKRSVICTSIAAEAIRQARYSFSFNRYIEYLQIEKETLKFTRKSLLDRAKEAEETLQFDSAVKEWLYEADTLIAKAQKLEEKAVASRSCCLGSFPNWIQRYRLGKQAERRIMDMIKHNENREFQQFFHKMEYYSSGDFIYFNSRKLAYYKLLEALKDDEVSMIGLYGKAGCGKTTLVKEVVKEAEQLFHRVVFAVVSNTSDVQMIQGQIASSLDLELMEEDESDRARHLFMRLTNGERILLILDDVWERFNLEGIGIPFGDNHKGCSVLIMTRSVLVCTLMGCQRTIPLSLLTEGEAWALFQNHASITEDTSHTLSCLAQEIARKCEGLPVAIVSVASTLKGKTEVEWKASLEMLKDSRPMDIEEGLENPYKCLELSYKNLEDENAKMLFLLCSLFPEDYEIPLEPLIRFGKGLGLVGEVSSYERARKQVIEAKNKLINSCLLLKDDKESWVKMHNLVRDIAVWIAKKENKVIMAPESSLNALKDSPVRYLWCDIFPDQLDYTNLELLLVSKNTEDCVEVADQVFKVMKELRVLVLANVVLENPKSIQWLTNLRCLFLQESELSDISFVGSLNRLETLMLWSCSIPELPYEITQLTNLQLLDLSECKIERNPYKVIGRCLQLEELYFTGNSCLEWKDQGENAVAFFDKNETTSKLKRYHIEIGKSFGVFDKGDFSSSRGLSIEYFDASTSNGTVKNLLQRAEVLSLGKISGGCENIIPDMVQKIGEGMNELIELQLCNSDEIKCMIHITTHVGTVFPSLTKLRMQKLEHMEALCCGPPPPGFFEKLKELELYDCPLLTSLFTVAVAQSLVMLQVMIITKCDGLKHIITDAEEEIIAIDDDQKNKSAFPKLERLIVQRCKQLEYLGHWSLNLCSLKQIVLLSCPMLISLFTPSIAETLMSLEELTIEECYSLEKVFAGPYAEDGQALMLPRLKMLRFTKLPRLIDVSHGFLLQGVYKTVVRDCPRFSAMSADAFQNFPPEYQNPVEEGQEFKEEDEEEHKQEAEVKVEERDLIEQCTTSCPENIELDKAKAGTPSGDDTVIPSIFSSGSGEANFVDQEKIKEPSQIVLTDPKEGKDDTLQTSMNQDIILNEEDQRSSGNISSGFGLNKATELIFNFPKHHDSKIKEIIIEEPIPQSAPYLQMLPEDLHSQVQATSEIELHSSQGGSSRCLPDKVAESEQEYKLACEFDASINLVHTQGKFQEQKVQPIGLLSLKEEMVGKAPVSAPVLMDQEQAVEQNKITIELSNSTDVTLEVIQSAMEHTNNNVSEALASKKLHLTAATSQLSLYAEMPPSPTVQSFTSQAEALVEEEGKESEDKGEVGNSTVIERSTTSCPRSWETQKESAGTPSLDGTSLPTITALGSAEAADAVHQDKMKVSSQTESTDPKQGRDLSLQSSTNQDVILSVPLAVSPDHIASAFNPNKVTETIFEMPKECRDYCQGLTKESKTKQRQEDFQCGVSPSAPPQLPTSVPAAEYVHVPLPVVIPDAPIPSALVSSVSLPPIHTLPPVVDPLSSSTLQLLISLVEEHGAFRDIGAIKKKQIPLLEQAIVKCPSLWAWHEKFSHPHMKQFGYTMLGNMLEFLTSTKWRDLTEGKKAEFESLMDVLKILGFDIQWLGDIHAMIKLSNEETIDQVKTLEEQVAALENELQNIKLKLDAKRVELGNFNNFIGF